MSAPDSGPQVDPAMVLRLVEASGETGAALVRAAHNAVLAQHYRAEADDLRQELAALRAQHDEAPAGAAP